jgi:two-component system chemotaxis response regulator CheB
MPSDMPASFLVVVHTAPDSAGLLARIIGRRAPFVAEFARDGAPLRRGRIYVAPPDHHLLLKPHRLCVARGPKENGFRPAVDPLFRTAANSYGPRVIGVILSGGLDDGTVGLMQIKEQGGIAVVQDPEEAPFPSMPTSAAQHVEVDHVASIAAMSALLPRLALEPLPKGAEPMPRQTEPDVAELGTNALVTRELPYPPSGLTCPECGGALWELKDGKLLRFRCHVGHGYTAESLQAEQSNGLEAALWTALRALEENAALRRRMARRASDGKLPRIADIYSKQADDAEARAAVIRKVLVIEPGNGNGAKGSRSKRGGRGKAGAPLRGRGRPSAATRKPALPP